MQAEDGNSADGGDSADNSDDVGDGAVNIGGSDGAGRFRSTVPVPIYIQNLHTKSSLPYKNSMGFYRERTKSAYLCVMVWVGEAAAC